MIEIEVKILEINKDEIISKLEINWAELDYSSDIEAFFFRNGEWKKIRLRKTNKWNNINFKKLITNDFWMSNIELETDIGEIEIIRKILLEVGFKEYWYSFKNRTSYKLNNITFDIDKYEWIPYVLEIEWKNNEDVKKGLSILWFDMKDAVNLTERELKEKYWRC